MKISKISKKRYLRNRSRSINIMNYTDKNGMNKYVYTKIRGTENFPVKISQDLLIYIIPLVE